MRAGYIRGLYPLAEMGPLLRKQAAQVGPDDAEVWVAINDGGSGREDFLERDSPLVDAVILDYYHASEYVAKLAKGLHPTDDGAALTQTKSWCRVLREEGGHTLIGVLEAWEWPATEGRAAVRAAVLGYLRNPVGRMDYPSTRRMAGSSVRGRWRVRARRWWASG
jgi:hypothetical protein